MRRATLCGRAPDKAATLDGLQALGVMHIVPLAARDPLATQDPAERRRAETAFRHVVDAPEQLRPYRPGTESDAEATIEAIMANRLRLRELADRIDALDALIAGLEPWGDFALPEPGEIGGQRLWLYLLPNKLSRALTGVDLPYEIVGRTNTALEVVVIASEEPPADLLPVPRTAAGDKPLSSLKAEREDLEIERERAEAARAELTRWRVLLGAALAAAQDADDRREVGRQTWDAGEVFAVQGWIAADAEAAFERFAEAHGLAVMVEEPGPADAPPTLLRPREERAAIGADLTNFYSTPGYRSWDPSLIVFVSFAIFFAMIVADAGYALLFALGTLAYWRRLGGSAAGRRARTLLAALSGACLVYGVLAGSYFGVAPPAGGLLARLAIVDVSDFDKMMRLSIVIGALHIGIALATVAWLNRGSGRALASLGWIAVLAGGLLVWLGEDAVRGLGFAALAGGLGAVFWGSASARPVQTPRDWLLRLSDGLLGLTGATKLFGDILSYLRLFALGLASASLAGTFNGLAAELRVNAPGLGVLLSVLILLFGHAINVAIGVMGGVVHGLRLNYVEFFGWGLTEEGYPFRAFAQREQPA
jgi:V/A-type H+-transporting ATPase subunit I